MDNSRAGPRNGRAGRLAKHPAQTPNNYTVTNGTATVARPADRTLEARP
jgi:hypothetical protein